MIGLRKTMVCNKQSIYADKQQVRIATNILFIPLQHIGLRLSKYVDACVSFLRGRVVFD